MTPTEILTAAGVFAALLWNVVNEIRLREHSKALQANEAHLRVRAELQLRLHQQSWDLLREIHSAATTTFETLRTYRISALHAVHLGDKKIPGADYQAALQAVQRFSGLAHVAPPDRELLRDAASGFTKAFNVTNESVYAKSSRTAEEDLNQFNEIARKALADAALGTKEWNEELWQQQTITALAKVEQN